MTDQATTENRTRSDTLGHAPEQPFQIGDVAYMVLGGIKPDVRRVTIAKKPRKDHKVYVTGLYDYMGMRSEQMVRLAQVYRHRDDAIRAYIARLEERRADHIRAAHELDVKIDEVRALLESTE